LLEVSIDGARGILFNVIGGNDLSMHEINSAAEAITAAADPDANIIFGATISPELDGEIIITVVATGFDASYFTKRETAGVVQNAPETSVVAPAALSASEKEMEDMDMDLKEHVDAASSDFHSNDPLPNIWSIADDDNKSDNDRDDDDGDQPSAPVVPPHDEDELSRPSFLRRLTKRVHKDESDDSHK